MAATSSLYASGPTLSEIQAGVPTLSEIETKVDEGPGLSTAIASIQRGRTVALSGERSFTISSVDTSKSYINILGFSLYANYAYSNTSTYVKPAYYYPRVWLHSSTTVKMQNNESGGGNDVATISWEVIEYV